jgi:8-oxo-dGTP diphosphatase
MQQLRPRQSVSWEERRIGGAMTREDRHAEPLGAAPARSHGVIAVTAVAGRFLSIRRGKTLRAGGKICFPGGHIEPGETEHEAVSRECQEELAAVVAPQARIWQSVTAWGTALSWWSVTLEDAVGLVPHPVEVEEILWLSLEELLCCEDLLEGNRPFLEAVQSGVIPLTGLSAR